MNTLDMYSTLLEKVKGLEETMECYRRDLRHALKDLNNDEFNRIRLEADILAKELHVERKRLERIEYRIAKDMRKRRPEPPESHPIVLIDD
jgi:hypothetical protein